MLKLQFDLGSTRNVQAKVLLNANENILKYQLKRVKAHKKYRKKVKKIRKEFQEGARQIIGETNYKKIEEFRKAYREKILEARECVIPYNDDSSKKFKKRKEGLEKERKDFYDQIGIDSNKMNTHFEKMRKKETELFIKITGIKKAPNKAATVLTHQPNSKTFNPPYDGHWQELEHFYPSSPLERNLQNVPIPNKLTGQISAESIFILPEADDNDNAWHISRTGIAIKYQMPSTGKVRISGKGEIIANHISGHLYNEYGTSDIDILQQVKAWAKIVHPTESSNIYSSFPLHTFHHRTDDSTGDWLNPHKYLPPYYPDGKFGFSFSPIPTAITQGTWIWIVVGFEQVNKFWSNDCEVHLHMVHDYLIREIEVSSTGG